jgi:hypothetical protein
MNDIKMKKIAVFIAIFQLSRKEKYFGEHFFSLEKPINKFFAKKSFMVYLISMYLIKFIIISKQKKIPLIEKQKIFFY